MSDSRLTPPEYVTLLDELWLFTGGVTVDPCGHRNSLVNAEHSYIWPRQNGLDLPWFGNVYINGPLF